MFVYIYQMVYLCIVFNQRPHLLIPLIFDGKTNIRKKLQMNNTSEYVYQHHQP